MSQSRRKQAEAAVIASARELFAPLRDGEQKMTVDLNPLFTAVEALRALDLTPYDNDSEGAYGVNSPDTSKNAAISVRATSSAVRRLILDELTCVYYTAAKGLLCDELERRINKAHTTTSSQCNWLLNHGWIEDSGYTRLTRSNRPAIVWRLTDAALDQIMSKGAP